jgi:hypothetical protein
MTETVTRDLGRAAQAPCLDDVAGPARRGLAVACRERGA